MIRTIKPFNNTRTFINTQKRFKSDNLFRNDWLNNSSDNIVCIVNENNYTNYNKLFNKYLKTNKTFVSLLTYKHLFPNNNDAIFDKFVKNNKTIFCEWNDLYSTIFYDEKILISEFDHVGFDPRHPIFPNAKNIFFNKTNHWFNNIWINKKVFPSAKTIFMNGLIDEPISDEFEIYVTLPYYPQLKLKNNHVKGITLEDYYRLIYDNEIVKPKTEKIL